MNQDKAESIAKRAPILCSYVNCLNWALVLFVADDPTGPLRSWCLVHAQRVREGLGRQGPRFEVFIQDRQGADAFDRKRSYLLVLFDPGDQIDAAIGVREPERIDLVVLRSSRRRGVVAHHDAPLTQGRVEHAGEDLAYLLVVLFLSAGRLRLEDGRKAVEELPAGQGSVRSSFMNARSISS